MSIPWLNWTFYHVPELHCKELVATRMLEVIFVRDLLRERIRIRLRMIKVQIILGHETYFSFLLSLHHCAELLIRLLTSY